MGDCWRWGNPWRSSARSARGLQLSCGAGRFSGLVRDLATRSRARVTSRDSVWRDRAERNDGRVGRRVAGPGSFSRVAARRGPSPETAAPPRAPRGSVAGLFQWATIVVVTATKSGTAHCIADRRRASQRRGPSPEATRQIRLASGAPEHARRLPRRGARGVREQEACSRSFRRRGPWWCFELWLSFAR